MSAGTAERKRSRVFTWEASDLPLEGITATSTDDESQSIAINLGKTPEDHVTHTPKIQNPMGWMNAMGGSSVPSFLQALAALAEFGERSGAQIREIQLYQQEQTVSADEIVTNIANAIAPETRVLALTWV